MHSYVPACNFDMRKIRVTNKPERKDPSDEGYKSRAEMKRETAKISQLGEKILALTEKQIAELPLQEITRNAILEAQNITSNIGKKRQLKFISKLLHEEDTDVIEEKLRLANSKHLLTIKEHHKFEQWRDRLLEQGNDAVFELLEEYPEIDRQQLRHLVRQANKEKGQDKPPKYQRELFRFLRDNIEL